MVSLREAAQPYLARLAARRTPASDANSTDEMGRAPLGAEARGDAAAHGAIRELVATPPACPLCHDAGFVRLDVPVGDKLFGQAVRCECKEREIEARERQKLRDLSSLKPFDKKGFESFDFAVPGVAEAYEVARRYAEDPNGWLILQGGYGCGKTHLAAAIARTREEAGETVFFSIAPDLLDHLRATFAPASEITYDELFDRVRHVGLLVLDDLGSENATAWATEKLFQIINYRYNYRLPTVITTNVRLLSHLDERIRSRLSDLGLVRWVRLEAGDYRERHVGHPGHSGPGSSGRGPRGGAPRGGSSRNSYGR
jgi:DNA replication protein DnaC